MADLWIASDSDHGCSRSDEHSFENCGNGNQYSPTFKFKLNPGLAEPSFESEVEVPAAVIDKPFPECTLDITGYSRKRLT